MDKVEIQGDVGGVFTGDVHTVHIHCAVEQRCCGDFALWVTLVAFAWVGLHWIFAGVI